MYNRMSTKEKIEYIYKRTRMVMFFTLIVLVLFFAIKELQAIFSFLLIISSMLLLIILLYNIFFPVNIFSKKVQITDGYIDEKKEYGSSGESRRFYGNAITLDESKKTPYKVIPHYFFRGRIPVKVIIYKNKAYDFIITKESYNYVNENLSENEKKGITIASIIGIILAIIVVIVIIKGIL